MIKEDYKLIEKICQEKGIDTKVVQPYTLTHAACCFAVNNLDNQAALDMSKSFCDVMGQLEEADTKYSMYLLYLWCICQDLFEKGRWHFNCGEHKPEPSVWARGIINDVYSSEPRTISGRISINNDTVDRLMVMSDADPEVFNVLSKLKSYARTVNKDEAPLGMAFSHLVPEFNLILGLDDMNVRGKQILYILEYTDGDYEMAVKLIRQRDGIMLSYVNKCVAEGFKFDPLHDKYIAVTGGASSTIRSPFGMDRSDLVMSTEAANKYKAINVQPKKLDYSSLDIIRGELPLDMARKIAEAHGFTEIANVPKIGERTDTGFFFLMFNEYTGDFLVAPHAVENDITYGGVKIIAARGKGNFWREVHGNTEGFDDDSDLRLYECGYDYGCFSQLRFLPEISADSIPWDAYPLKGMVSLPYPTVYNESELFSLSNDLPDELSYYFTLLHNESYTIMEWTNRMLAPEVIQEHIKPEYHKYFSAMLNNKYEAFAKAAYLSIRSRDQIVEFFRLAAFLAKISTDEILKYKAAIIAEMKKEGLEEVESLEKLSFQPDDVDQFVLSYARNLNIKGPKWELREDIAKAVKWIQENRRTEGKTIWDMYSTYRNDYQESL